MKKLLLVGMVAIGFAHEASAMKKEELKKGGLLAKKGEDDVYMPVIHTNDYHSVVQSGVLNQMTLPHLLQQLVNLVGQDRKDFIKEWCDKFKQDQAQRKKSRNDFDTPLHKNPFVAVNEQEQYKSKAELVQGDRAKHSSYGVVDGVEAEIIQKQNEQSFWQYFWHRKSDLEFVDRLKNLQENEWNTWEDVKKIKKYQMSYPEKSDWGHSSFGYKSFIRYVESKLYKKVTQQDDQIHPVYNELENNNFHESLQSLQITKEVVEHDLCNEAYLSRLWNYSRRQRTHETLNLLNDEIKNFTTNADIKDEGKDKLTYRQVFTKSCLPRSIATKINTSRE